MVAAIDSQPLLCVDDTLAHHWLLEDLVCTTPVVTRSIKGVGWSRTLKRRAECKKCHVRTELNERDHWTNEEGVTE